MNPTDLVKWTDPRTWPFPIYIWLAFAVFGLGSAAWKRYRISRANGWPTAQARIESAEVEHPKTLGLTDTRPMAGVIAYSYSAMGSTHCGRYSRTYGDAESAQELIRDLQGATVTVNFNPEKPSESVLTDASLELLLQSRPDATDETPPVPAWVRPLLWPATVIAAVGLVLSICVHGAALLGQPFGGIGLFIALHVGSIALAFLAVPATKTLFRSASVTGRQSFKELLRGAPEWMLYMVYIFFAYAFVNFIFFFVQQPSGGQDTLAAWRKFSDGWLAFYSVEMATFYAAAARLAKEPKCLNGHSVWRHGDFCPKCGQPVVRS